MAAQMVRAGATARWFSSVLIGVIAGCGVVAALTLVYPLSVQISLIPLAALGWWMYRVRAPYAALAGLFLGLGVGLAVGGFVGANQCATLRAAGGLCEGPDLLDVTKFSAAPLVCGALLAILGRRFAR